MPGVQCNKQGKVEEIQRTSPARSICAENNKQEKHREWSIMCSHIPWQMVMPPESTPLASKFLGMSPSHFVMS